MNRGPCHVRLTERRGRASALYVALVALVCVLSMIAVTMVAIDIRSGAASGANTAGTQDTDAAKARPSAWAPAASAGIAFVRGGDIWTVAADGREPRRLTSGSTVDRNPAWSPDRETIAFIRQPDGPEGCFADHKVFLVAAAGGAVRQLEYEDALGRTAIHVLDSLAFSPDGRQLAFADMYAVTLDEPEYSRVVIVDLEAGTSEVVLRRKNGFGALDAYWTLSWSPDGETMLVAQAGMDVEGCEARILDLASKRLRKLCVADAVRADWSPDGELVVVSSATQARSRIVLARANGTLVGTLARGGYWEAPAAAPPVLDACFSADGKWIAYTVESPKSGKPALWVVGPDGAARHRLTAGETAAWR